MSQPAREQPPAHHRLWNQLFFLAVAFAAILLLLKPFFRPVLHGDYYIYLAENLLQGRLYVDNIPAGYGDLAVWQGHLYIVYGLLPAVLLVPFLPLFWLTGVRDITWVGQGFTLINIILMWGILERLGVAGERRRWALLLFFGGTVYYSVAVAAGSTYFAHIVVVTCLLLAVRETLTHRRWLLVGLFVGLAGLTRFTALFSLPFFLWLMWWGRAWNVADERSVKRRWVSGQFVLLCAGVGLPLLLQFTYNYLRFGSLLESGYAMAGLVDSPLWEARSQGLFGLVHVPKNLFMLLFQGPLPYPSADAPVLQFPYIQPSPWGMGLFITTPAFVYAFRAKLMQPIVQACWLGLICTLLPILMYYGVGWVQFGYRYALDFIPFLFLLFVLALPRSLTRSVRLLVLVSVAVNIWGAFWVAKWM